MPIQRPLPPAGKPPIAPLPNPGVRPPRGGKPVQPPYGGKPPIKPLPKPGVRPPREEKPMPADMANPVMGNKFDAEKLAMARAAGAEPPLPYNPQVKTGMKKGGSVSSASKRADGVATKGKTRGKMC